MKKILSLFILLFSGISLSALPSDGGSISWKLNSNGAYIFTLNVLRPCALDTGFSTIDSLSGPNGIKIAVFRAGTDTLRSYCGVPSDEWQCGSGDANIYHWVHYTSAPVSLSGTIPASGWEISHSGCCSRTGLQNTNDTNAVRLRAIMYPDPSSGSGNLNDASPVFLQYPVMTMRMKGWATEYLTNLAITNDPNDSLYYEFVTPETTNGPISFNGGYSFDAPLPDVSEDQDNGMNEVEHTNGTVTVDIDKSNVATGHYAYALRVETWRQGVRVSEVVRELTVRVDNFNGQSPPGGVIDTTQYTSISRLGPNYVTTREVGSNLQFIMAANDSNFNSNGTPETVTFDAFGYALDTNWNKDQNPPLNSFPVITPVAPQSGFSSYQNNYVNFNWNITPDLLKGSQTKYQFTFIFRDNDCPYPRESEINLTVIVVPQIGISESMSEMGIGVYPNPARDHVEFSGIEQYGSIEVFLNDMNGKLLLRKELSDSGNNQLELSGLPSGTYIVKGVVDNGSTFRKLIVKE